jgi:hypothetical protein
MIFDVESWYSAAFGKFLFLLLNPGICAKTLVRFDVWYLLLLDALPFDVALADRLKL